MSGIVLTEVADATIPAPAAGKVTVYMSTEEAGPAFKDDADVVTPLQGAAGSPGATGPGYAATSTTSFAIGTGSKAFTTQAGLAYVAGSRVRAASNADPDGDWMEGVCTGYSGTTLTVLIDLTGGSGTHTDWNLSIAGEAPAAWLGAWSGATTYAEGDAVSNDGSSYVCILGHTNQEPPNGTYWDVLAAGAATLDAVITASSGEDIADALAGAAAPDAGNVFATMADVGAGGGITHSTVGTTSAGASFQTTRGTYLKKITLASAGFIASVVCFIKGDGSTRLGYNGVLFNDVAGVPVNIIAVTGPSSVSSANITSTGRFNTTVRALTQPLGYWAAAGDYWVGINQNIAIAGLAFTASTGSDRFQATTADTSSDVSVVALSGGTTDDNSIYVNILR